MSWSDFYLLCFFVGFLFSILSFLGGATHIHLPARFHWPFHFGHHAGGMAGRGTRHARGGLSLVHAMTIMTFLSWVGGVWLLLSARSRASARGWFWGSIFSPPPLLSSFFSLPWRHVGSSP